MSFAVGDKVRVVRIVKDNAENGMGEGKLWDNVWVSDMTLQIGQEFTIDNIDYSLGASFAEDNNEGFMFPLSSLEKVVNSQV